MRKEGMRGAKERCCVSGDLVVAWICPNSKVRADLQPDIRSVWIQLAKNYNSGSYIRYLILTQLPYVDAT